MTFNHEVVEPRIVPYEMRGLGLGNRFDPINPEGVEFLCKN